MARDTTRYLNIATDVVSILATMGLSFYLIRYGMSKLDLGDTDTAKRKAAAAAVMQKIDARERRQIEDDGIYDDDGGRTITRKQDLVLNTYEQTIAAEVIAPEDISIGFHDIGGLQDVIEELKEAVVYPLTMPHLYSRGSSLLAAPSGVLLYGPPGCGKTMLAKALAKESGANFLNVQLHNLTDKWFGDSNKLVAAVFSLARKLQPTIIFIDEIDAVLGKRHSGEHEASNMLKAEMLTHLDGLRKSVNERIILLGATNRQEALDPAFKRRMPKQFLIDLPNSEERKKILVLLLKDTRIDRDFDLGLIIKVTDGLSGSDLKEVCRDAAMIPVREAIRAKRSNGERLGPIESHEIRGLRTEDFFKTKGGIFPQVSATKHQNLADGDDQYESVSE